ncbi:hypothetical protein, partial [Enterobacter hormaechei]|uniref:hypothetical protein n=1 Tax=Enterobacter hormaechei TaxID=158836 RepID=UPI00195526AF
GKGWFCRPGKRSATRRNLQRPPIPPDLLRPVQRRIGAGNDFRPDWLDGWCETKSVCVCGIKKNAGWRLRLTRPTG